MSRLLKTLTGRAAAADSDAPWYAEGIRFSCTGSGKCCTIHGDYAYVFVTRSEEKAIAEHRKLTLKQLRSKHTYRPSGQPRSLRFPDGRCTFVKNNQCTIYEARPQQCRTWPFWKENLDPETWVTDVAAFCPGIGQGRLYTKEEIERIAKSRLDAK